MSNYEQQVLNTEKFYDQAMRDIETSAGEILYSNITGDQVHKKINNPTVEGIDEG